eukprot:4468731-Pyramimonas_sp.AAC.2
MGPPRRLPICETAPAVLRGPLGTVIGLPWSFLEPPNTAWESPRGPKRVPSGSTTASALFNRC